MTRTNKLKKTQNNFSKYNTPDLRWTSWGVNSHHEFLEKFMIKGKFIGKVPQVIKDDYEIVERLITYSYYHYPLLDEAFAKATRLFEGAINIRMKEFNLEPKKGFETLKNKLKRLEPYTTTLVSETFEKARKARNMYAHMEAGQFMGIAIHSMFYHMINLYNTLFTNKSDLEYNEKGLKALKEEAKYFKHGGFSIEIKNQKILIGSIIPYSFYEKNNIKMSLWVFHPILTKFPQTVDIMRFTPIFLRLRDVQIIENKLIGFDLIDQIERKVETIDFEKNRSAFELHKSQFENSEQTVKDFYLIEVQKAINYQVGEFLYEECW